jgi:hypothetical protein
MTAKIEGSTENLADRPERTFGINGLNDVPRSIIPVPYYKLVQPNSTKVILPDGKRAPDGAFLMQDVRKFVKELEFLILRAKRQTRDQKGDDGQLDKVVSLNVLGLNLANKKPFILSVPVTSFSAFGKIFEELEEMDVKNAWECSVSATTFEKQEEKETATGLKRVNYWVIELEILGKPDKETEELAQDYYDDFAAKLDRNDEDDLDEIAGKIIK